MPGEIMRCLLRNDIEVLLLPRARDIARIAELLAWDYFDSVAAPKGGQV